MSTIILSKLESKRRTDIIDALYEAKHSNLVPKEKILERIIQLISHSDADIRELAVNVAGINLQLEEAYKVFLHRINYQEEKDQFVLTAISAALSTLVIRGKGNRNKVNPVLAHIVLNEDFDPELRGTAYLSLKRINNKISPQEYAASPQDIEQMQCNFEWVKSLSR